MTTQTTQIVLRDNLLRNRDIYPPNCVPAPADDIVYHPYYRSYIVKYLRESRPKPKLLLSSMTARERVVTIHDKRGTYWTESKFDGCPHGGVHGKCTHQSYMTDVSQWNGGVLFPDIDSLKSRNLWSGPLRDKMGRQQINLGSSLAEYRESCKMFAGFAGGLWNAYRAIRGKQKRRKITIRDIPASVLAFNFGIAPLANDVYSSVEMLKTRMKKPTIQRISGSYFQGRKFNGLWGSYEHKSSGEFRQRATVYIHRSNFAGINGDFDFGNPIEWAWELIPFSFVVDWAIPIGEWLGRLDAMVGNQVLSGSVVTKTVTKTEYHPPDATHILSPGRADSKTYERDLIDSIPIPELPRWAPSASYKRAINATALLWLLSGRIR